MSGWSQHIQANRFPAMSGRGRQRNRGPCTAFGVLRGLRSHRRRRLGRYRSDGALRERRTPNGPGHRPVGPRDSIAPLHRFGGQGPCPRTGGPVPKRPVGCPRSTKATPVASGTRIRGGHQAVGPPPYSCTRRAHAQVFGRDVLGGPVGAVPDHSVAPAPSGRLSSQYRRRPSDNSELRDRRDTATASAPTGEGHLPKAAVAVIGVRYRLRNRRSVERRVGRWPFVPSWSAPNRRRHS